MARALHWYSGMNEPSRKRVLVSWGSKLGGTEGIAQIIGDALEAEGVDVVRQPAAKVLEVSAYDAAIIGGALYANRWHRDARRLVARNVAALRRIPVWFFSSGPLDDSADGGGLAPAPQVATLLERVGAVGHMTFGGRLAADVKGFPAEAMAKKLAGDWRNPDRIRGWAAEVARVLPTAQPRPAIEPPARSWRRLLAHGVLGWALCAALTVALSRLGSLGVTMAVRAFFAPLVFLAISIRYFHPDGAREPLPTALSWSVILAVLDAAVLAGAMSYGLSMFTSIVGTWLPYSLVFLTTWLTGGLMSTMPWPKPRAGGSHERGQELGAEHGARTARS